MKILIAFFIKILPAIAKILSERRDAQKKQADKQDGYDHAVLQAHEERENLDAAKHNADVSGVSDSDLYKEPVRRKPKNS